MAGPAPGAVLLEQDLPTPYLEEDGPPTAQLAVLPDEEPPTAPLQPWGLSFRARTEAIGAMTPRQLVDLAMLMAGLAGSAMDRALGDLQMAGRHR